MKRNQERARSILY